MTLGTGMIYMICILANFVIAFGSAGFAGYIMFGDGHAEQNSMAFPILASFMVSFAIAKLFLGVWDAAATTLLVCICMLKEWYPDEYGRHLAKKAKFVSREQAEGEVMAEGQIGEA